MSAITFNTSSPVRETSGSSFDPILDDLITTNKTERAAQVLQQSQNQGAPIFRPLPPQNADTDQEISEIEEGDIEEAILIASAELSPNGLVDVSIEPKVRVLNSPNGPSPSSLEEPKKRSFLDFLFSIFLFLISGFGMLRIANPSEVSEIEAGHGEGF